MTTPDNNDLAPADAAASNSTPPSTPQDSDITEAGAETRRIRYLLERRLGRSVETLASETIGQPMAVHVVFLDQTESASFHPSRRDLPYCRLVYSSAKGLKRCSDCYRSHLAKAQHKDEPLTFTCHAGLTVAMVPIQVHKQTIAGLLLGRVFTKKPATKQKQALAASLKDLCPVRSTVRALDKVPELSETNLQLAALIARNLVRAEGPMPLESHVFSPIAQAADTAKGREPVFQPSAEPIADRKLLRHKRICQRVTEILDQQYASPVSVLKLADAFKLTPNYLSAVFHRNMKVTISEYLTDVRIRMAKSFMQRADINVKEVAFRVGFNDASHFAVVFKKKTGFTPSEWRARLDEKILDGAFQFNEPASPPSPAPPPEPGDRGAK